MKKIYNAPSADVLVLSSAENILDIVSSSVAGYGMEVGYGDEAWLGKNVSIGG